MLVESIRLFGGGANQSRDLASELRGLRGIMAMLILTSSRKPLRSISKKSILFLPAGQGRVVRRDQLRDGVCLRSRHSASGPRQRR